MSLEEKINKMKHLYDESVEYDEENLPNGVKEYINELLEFDKTKDWVSYDMKFYEFEMILRDYLRKHKISEYDYKKLTAKYGWLYD